jgi:hypothetical protein
MKRISIFSFFMATVFICNAQVDSTLRRPISKTLPQKSTGTQTIKQSGLNTPVPKLPDLKFTNVTVTATATGAGVYTLDVSFTVKNDGTAPILTSDVSVQGYITDEVGFARTQDILFTGTYRAGCGTSLSSGTGVFKGEMLEAGASRQSSLRCFNVQLQKTPRPVYYITLNPFSDIKELNRDNNRVPTTILL